MSALETILANAKASPAHIVLPEGNDRRIVEGATRAVNQGVATVTLLGNVNDIREMLKDFDGAVAALTAGKINILDPAQSEREAFYVEEIMRYRGGKIASEKAAMHLVRDPLVYAAMMVRTGDADGTLGGAVYTTADTVRVALQIIGKSPDAAIVSSFFLMVLPNGRDLQEEVVAFSDCGLVVEPDARQLAAIAVTTAVSFTALTGQEPLVGMLSFSTKGSARHASVSKVAEAARLASEMAPDLKVDGEMQFDAAFDAGVGSSKAPNSEVAGKANVFIFPNLDAGNIGYKIAQRIGGAMALGPILQGLSKPANDLSRGCNAEDVFNMIAVTVNQVRLVKS